MRLRAQNDNPKKEESDVVIDDDILDDLIEFPMPKGKLTLSASNPNLGRKGRMVCVLTKSKPIKKGKKARDKIKLNYNLESYKA